MTAPAPFEVGIDVEPVVRFDGEATAELFTAEEHAFAQRLAQPADGYAQTWCIKEAAIKALWPWMHLDSRRIAVTWPEGGDPTFDVDGAPLGTYGLGARASSDVSSTTAMAVVIVWQGDQGG